MGMKKTLLIVEDNLILCDILERWLQKAGYGVLTAIDEPSARRKIKGNNVALVLTDVRLPEGMASAYWNGASPKGYISLLW